MAETNLIPNNVTEEFKRRLQDSRGYDAKRASARQWVYSILVGRFTRAWYEKNRKAILEEMDVIENNVKLERRSKTASRSIQASN